MTIRRKKRRIGGIFNMDDMAKSLEKSSRPIQKVTVHPLVLLSIIDHKKRLSTAGRAVGVLLGSSFKGIVDISNSYAVPFEEKSDDPSDWFLDLDYVEEMFALFKKLSAKEHIVGWYSTRYRLQENDLDIHELFYKYIPNPVVVLTDTEVRSKVPGIPTEAYYCDVEEGKEHAVTKRSKNVFVHVPSEYAADEAEEIGVGYLLRDIEDTTSNTLATKILPAHFPFSFKFPTRVSDKLTAFKCLQARLSDMLNHLPNLNDSELIKALIGSLIRCVIALDNLIGNKIMKKEI